MNLGGTLLYILGVVLFAAGVAISIGLHELGHLIPGKLFNVKITQYFIGFGRTVWSRRRGETEYGVKAVPLGGYVKLVGMLPPEPDAEPGTVPSRNTGMFAQLASDAREMEYEHVGPEDHDRLFYNKPWWQRVIIMVCGVAINIVLAFLLFMLAFMGIGTMVPNTTVGTVSRCVKVVNANTNPGPCTKKDPRSPAYRAGLRPGDRIVSFNGKPIHGYNRLQDLIRANDAGRARIGVVRHGRRLTLRTSTAMNRLPGLKNPDKVVHAGFLGITPQMSRQRTGIGDVVSTMSSGTWETLVTIGHLPNRLYHVARAALHLEKRNPNSPMSIVGAGRIAGETASNTHTSVASRLYLLVVLLGSINLFLGLVNLVPLPPFDGGGIATTLYETVRRALARLLGRPDPGAVDGAKLLPVTYAMVGVILLISVVLIYADVVAPVQIN